MRSTGGSRGQGLVLPAILLILGLLVTAALVQERAQERRLPEQTENLVDLVRRRQATVRDLAGEVRSLSEELARAEQAGGRESDRVGNLIARAGRLRVGASLEPLSGPGIVVEMADSPDDPRTRGDVTDLRIQDVDLRLVVNALWAAGAEAVGVNGNRVSGTTAIGEAGDSVLVNFRAVSSPYRVAAIGDPEVLRSGLLGSEIARQFEVWTQVYGLGFTVGVSDAVTIAAAPGEPDLAWAHPTGEGS